MPNEKEKKQLTKEYEKIYDKVLYLVDKHSGINEQFMAFLLYLSTENLVKQSSKLNWLTGALIVFVLAQIALILWQIILIS